MSKQLTEVEGPRGYKMSEALARQIEALEKTQPSGDEFAYRRIAVQVKASDFTLDAGDRSDISWISTDDVDRQGEVLLPGGMDKSDYAGTVTWCHDYKALPVGRNAWIKPKGNGLIGKTIYAKKPEGWGDWLPDALLSLMSEGMCTGKSVGLLPTNVRRPTSAETAARPEMEKSLVVTNWKLLEYAATPLGVNPKATLIAVSKSFGGEIAEVVESAFARLKGIGVNTDPDADPKDHVEGMGDPMTDNQHMPACPQCCKPDFVKPVPGKPLLYYCQFCKDTMGVSASTYEFAAPRTPHDKALPAQPETPPEMIEGYAIRKAMELLAGEFATVRAEMKAQPELIAKRLKDQIDELLGRP